MLQRAVLVAISFLTGMAMLVLEMSAARVLAPYFGSSLYVWTNIIATILAALAAGYWLGGLVAERGAGARGVASILAAAGLAALAVPWLVAPAALAVASPQLGEVALRSVVLRGSLFATLVLFAPAMVLLGAVSPMLVKLLAGDMGAGRASGTISGAGTVGALAGTYVTTLWLIPMLGTRATVALAGAFLVLAASACLLAARSGVPAMVLLIVAGPVALLSGSRAITFISDPRAHVLAVRETPYQFATVQQAGNALLLLLNESRTTPQSVLRSDSVLTGNYCDYTLLMPSLAARPPGSPLRICILGLAAGSMSRLYHQFFGHRGALEIDGVEIDPGILDLGREYFKMTPQEQPFLRQIEADARVFLDRSPANFDVIVLDCFSTGVYIPFHLVTREFFTVARQRLAPGGVFCINVISQVPRSPLVAAIESAMKEAFGEVYRFRIPGYRNFLLFVRAGQAPPDLTSANRWLEQLRVTAARSPSTPSSETGLLADRLSEALARIIRVPRELLAGSLEDDRAPVERLTDLGFEAMQRSPPPPFPASPRGARTAPSGRLADPLAELARLRGEVAGDSSKERLTALRQMLEDLERYEEALSVCDEQIARWQNDSDLLLARIELLAVLYRFREAADTAVKGLGLFPDERRFPVARAAYMERDREREIMMRDRRRAGLLSATVMGLGLAALGAVAFFYGGRPES